MNDKIYITGLGRIDADSVGFENMRTGYVHDVKPAISRAINRIIKSRRPATIKIGKTGDIDARRQGHGKFNGMEVLYRSNSIANVEELEAYYIDFVRENYPRLAANMRGGSAGVMANSKKYHLYLVLG
jgi:hypothetical protein